MAVGDGYVSSYKLGRERYHSSSDMTTMRIAVAGTGGLARLIAGTIAQDTTHNVVLLSRRQNHGQALAAGIQFMVINYNDGNSLAFALRGVDTVISTVGGSNQIALIHAAVHGRVRRFVPAEFEGVPQPQAVAPSDQSKLAARQLLQSYYAGRIESTIFVCGIFYERFQPGGLHASRIGTSTGISGQGDYMIDCGNMTANVAAIDVNGAPASICMTAAADVARFVTRALDMQNWPPRLYMFGERITVYNLAQRIRAYRSRDYTQYRTLTPPQIQHCLNHAASQRDRDRFRAMLNTAEGHYDYHNPSLNMLFPDVDTMSFETWFQRAWP